MTGRHQYTSGGRPRLRWLVAAALSLLVSAGAVLGFSLSPAGAATTVKAQLTLSGLASSSNPVGGSRIGVHPGDTVQISPSTAPTAGLDQLGLGGLVGGLLNTLAGFQVTADFSHLPGGHADTVIKSSTQPLSFTFPTAGTYDFTWTAQQVSLLGIIPIQLDGNQLAQAGIKLNAANQYVGQIVVADNPPGGGIGIQLPSVGVHPSVPVLGQLPSVGLPGVTVTLPVNLPSLPGLGGGGGNGGGASSGSHGGGHPGAGGSSSGGGLPVPALVVPGGGNQGVAGGGGGGIFNTLPLPDLANPGGTNGLLPLGSASSAAAPAASHPSAVAEKSVGLASPKPGTSQLSVVLALIAIVALALVAGVYAKLYVLRRD